MGTRRERQRQGQSDQKRPQDPEKGGHSRPAGRRQRQETEITVPERTPGGIFSSVRPYTTKRGCRISATAFRLAGGEENEPFPYSAVYQSVIV